MKIKVMVVLVFVLLLTGCTEKINEEFGYTLTKINDDFCATALEVVYTDDEYEHGFGCLESDKYIISDEEGNEYSIYDVIDEELLTIEQLYILFDGYLYRFDGYLYRTEIINDVLIESETEYLSIDIDNLTISSTSIIIDEGGYMNWPFDGYPDTIELDIDYTEVEDEFKEIMLATDGVQICNGGPLFCVIYGPMPAFRIYFNDGVNFLNLSIDVKDVDGEQIISVIRVLEGSETRLTIPSSDLREEYNAIFYVIDNAYQEYLSTIE